MDGGAGFSLCQPSLAILLVSVAGVLYHLIVGAGAGIMWWLAVGAVGTVVFQALCFGGLEPVAWVLMLIPVLLVCFFLAVALFSSSVRIKNVEKVPCGRCGQSPCGCERKHHHHRHHDRPPCGGGGCDGGGCQMCNGGYLEQQ
jgi:hypothetical protein